MRIVARPSPVRMAESVWMRAPTTGVNVQLVMRAKTAISVSVNWCIFTPVFLPEDYKTERLTWRYNLFRTQMLGKSWILDFRLW